MPFHLHHRYVLYVLLVQLFARDAALEQSFDCIAYTPHSFLYVLRFGIGITESKVLLASPIDMERFANDKGHLLVCGFA